MRTVDSFTDDAGQKWEFRYDEEMLVPVLDLFGEPVTDEDGRPRTTSRVRDLTFRKEGAVEWQTLPPWADVRDRWKTTLCFFDEDDDGGHTYWELAS